MRYIVQVQVEQKVPGGWLRRYGIPTFILDGDTLGIISEFHAKEIASSIVNSTRDPDVTAHVTVVPEK